MAHILARISQVKFDALKKQLKTDAPQHARDGMHLIHLWKNADDSDDILFLFHAEDLDKAKQIIQKNHTLERRQNPGANLPQMTFLEEG